MPYSSAIDARDDFAVNNFSPAGGAVSAHQNRTIYDRPLAEMAMLFARHIGYFGLSTFLKAAGFSRAVNTPTTGHYEQPWRDDVIKVGSVITAASGAGNDIIIAVHSDNMYDTSVTTGGSARKTSRARVGEVIEFPGRIQARVTAKNVTTDPHRLTLTPLDSTVDLDDHVEADGIAFILAPVFGEGQGLPTSIQPRVSKWTNTFAIVKESYTISGTEQANVVQFVEMANGGIEVLLKDDLLYRFERGRDLMLTFGQQADNIDVASEGLGIDVPIAGTEGFYEFADNNGANDTYTSGSYGISDFTSIANYFDDARVTGTPDICAWLGQTLENEIEDQFTQTFANDLTPLLEKMLPDMGGYITGLPDYTSSDFSVHIGYRAVKKNHYIFHFKRSPAFNDIKGAGAEGHGYRAVGVFHPFGGVKDVTTKKLMPNVGYEYKAVNGYSREFVIGKVAGVGSENSGVSGMNWITLGSENDVAKYGMVCEIAGHWICGSHFLVQEPE